MKDEQDQLAEDAWRMPVLRRRWSLVSLKREQRGSRRGLLKQVLSIAREEIEAGETDTDAIAKTVSEKLDIATTMALLAFIVQVVKFVQEWLAKREKNEEVEE
jgi:hypothetical protein